jgi:hypothetical protein
MSEKDIPLEFVGSSRDDLSDINKIKARLKTALELHAERR